MKERTHTPRGFTLVELLVVIGVGVIMFVVTAGAFSAFTRQSVLDREVQIVRSTVQDARSRTVLAENDLQYGVHFESNQITLFAGGAYNASDPNNEVVPIDARVSLSDIAIATSSNDIVFKKVTGEASAHGTTTVSLVSDPTQAVDLVVASSGAIFLVE